MKKIFTLSIMFMLAVSAMAQNYAMQITKVDGSVVLLPASKVEMVQFVVVVPADEIAGEYTGTMTMAMAYGTYSYEDQTVTITSEGETVAITYSGDLGNCDLSGLAVTEEDGNYVIAETEVVFSMGMSADSVKEYACIVSASIATDLSDYSIVFYLPSVMGGTTLTLAPAAE